MKKIVLSTLAVSLLTLSANAAQTGIISHAELGYVNTTGNTETQTFTLDANMKKDWEKHAALVKLEAAYGEDNEVETKNKFFIEGSYDYKFSDKIAFNYLAAYKQDKFTDYNYQAYTGPGVKYNAIANKEHTLDLTASALYSMDEFRVDDSEDTYGAYKFGAAYGFIISENLKFTQDFDYRADFEDAEKYFITSKSAITTKISDMLSAGISYKIDYINLVADDKENSDNTLAFNLIFDY